MATNDVPGANPKNFDTLEPGAWAEHSDGSLVYVKGLEAAPDKSERVIYEIYDMAHEPVLVYTDAMRVADFKRQFSVPPTGTSKVAWTWHDKTAFPWDRVIKSTQRPAPGYASAEDHMTVAERLGRSLRLRAREIQAENIRHRREEEGQKAARSIGERIGAAIQALVGE